ncbi:hypothetical protein HPB49_023327 [Dermacentor silvarum]|uniref:Uncharacterized protein n=1 Tax=Dermacentor silvarum TaxID=543639 RepID=A0ACB8CHX1_DERSI|nr:ovalbumin [Dermacentor silvarum]KAH7942353.1 hypothetical protein HPB49_023327 [Dermacentor silvarum]
MATGVLTLKLAFDQPFHNPRVQLPFFTSSVESQSVESMHTVGTFGYKQLADRGFDAVALPLLSGNLSLLLLMPVDGSSLAAVRKSLVMHPDVLLNLEAEMDPTVVEVTLPRFKVTAVCGLKSALTSLGHGFVFDRFQTNMGAVSRHGHAYVSNILNAVSLDVGPITATATATTSGGEPDAPVNEAADASTTNPAVAFHVNRPFIYVVTDKTDGLPLAIGQFVDPSGTANDAASKL